MKSVNPVRLRSCLISGMCVLLIGLVLSACGSGGSSSGGATAGGGTVTKTALANYEKELESFWTGTYIDPVGPSISPPAGKKIAIVSLSQSIEASQDATTAMTEAAKKLGWDVSVFDGKFETSQELTGIQQAIASKADGIVLLYVDCAAVKSGLEQAKAAGIPVSGIESQDCSPSLETNVKYAHNMPLKGWSRGAGRSQMAWVVAKTKGEAKVIVAEETDLVTTRIAGEAWKEQIAKCATCEIVDTIQFVGSELGPPLQQKIEQALNSNPDANAFIPSYDAVLTSGGGAAALRSSGRLPEIAAMGGEGSRPGIELIYGESGAEACYGVSTAQLGYEAVAILARGLSGENPADGNSGIGWQICEKGHNLPPKGQSYQPPIAYVEQYEKMWQLNG